MEQFIFRTEDFVNENVLDFFVETYEDRKTVDLIKSTTPVVLEGSRGVGKSFLMKVAEAELTRDFLSTRIFPVYVTFNRSSLIHTNDAAQFRNWMLARICSRVLRSLRKAGLHSPSAGSLSLLSGPGSSLDAESPTTLDEVARLYEESWKSPGVKVDASAVPDVDELKDTLEDVCVSAKIKRFCFLFDEAAHIFRPEQQRQFFTLFRDLRSPYITCNAAVYPGITSYGPTFQLSHDATLRRVERDVQSKTYLDEMRQIVEKQANGPLLKVISRNKNNFDAITYAVHGNPRYLLRVVDAARKMNSNDVTEAIKFFYRTEIWTEHSKLGDDYTGHRHLVDWGRWFIEEHVLKEIGERNSKPNIRDSVQSTCYFWIHRDSPEVVKNALRLLEYMGIVQKGPELLKGTRSELGTRYALNLGCIFASLEKPITEGLAISKTLAMKRFVEYGAKHTAYQPLLAEVKKYSEPDMYSILQSRLSRPLDGLEITEWQKSKLKEKGLKTVGDILKTTLEELDNIKYFGVHRSSQVLNAAMAAVLEYLSD